MHGVKAATYLLYYEQWCLLGRCCNSWLLQYAELQLTICPGEAVNCQ